MFGILLLLQASFSSSVSTRLNMASEFLCERPRKWHRTLFTFSYGSKRGAEHSDSVRGSNQSWAWVDWGIFDQENFSARSFDLGLWGARIFLRDNHFSRVMKPHFLAVTKKDRLVGAREVLLIRNRHGERRTTDL